MTDTSLQAQQAAGVPQVIEGTVLVSAETYTKRWPESQLLELIDLDDDSTPDEIIMGAIHDTASTVAGQLAQRHELPLPEMPFDLQRQANAIFRWFLYRDHPTKRVEKEYEMAIQWLKGLKIGSDQLKTAGGGELEKTSIVTHSRKLAFSPNDQRHYSTRTKL